MIKYINDNPEYGIKDVLENSGGKAYARGVKNE